MEAINWAINILCPSPGAKLILVLLANYADEDGECYPGQERISKQASMSVRAVRDNIGKLEEFGLIERVIRQRKDGRGRTSDLYRLNLTKTNRQISPVEQTTNRQISHDQPAESAEEPSVEPLVRTLPSEGAPDGAEAEREFFAEGKRVLGPRAGGLLAKLKKHHGLTEARRLVGEAVTKQDRAEWLAATMLARGPAPPSRRDLDEAERKFLASA